MSLTTIESSGDVETYRDVAAKRIKQLMVQWTANTLEIAAELFKARETFPPDPRKLLRDERPGFGKWAQQTTGLSSSQIVKLVAIHKKFGRAHQNIRLAQNVMVLLSAKDVPASARQEAIDRAAKGEHIGHKEAKKIAKVHKLPSPKAANTQAKDEGRPVLASDGYIYFGTDPGRAKEGEDRRTMVYGVRKALDTLGNIHLTGRQFLEYALPHQLWDADEAKIIKHALRWLGDLDAAWDAKE
jgi:hypothetical protein